MKMAFQIRKGWNILNNFTVIIINGRVGNMSIYEMISKISSMCIKHKYVKRNFLADGPFVFMLPKL